MNNNFGVIFDLDGTMVDNTLHHRQAWIDLCKVRGREITVEYYNREIHSRTNDVIIRNLFGADSPDEFIKEIADEKEKMYRRSYGPVLKEVPGLTALVRELHEKDIPAAVATNAPYDNVVMAIEKLRLAPYFAAIVTERDVSKGKPDPEIFAKAAAMLNLSPARCLIFEDSPAGFLAAERAGARYIAVDLKGTLATHEAALAVIPDFTEVSAECLTALFARG